MKVFVPKHIHVVGKKSLVCHSKPVAFAKTNALFFISYLKEVLWILCQIARAAPSPMPHLSTKCSVAFTICYPQTKTLAPGPRVFSGTIAALFWQVFCVTT